MATIIIAGSNLVIRLSRWEQLLGFHGNLHVPLARIGAVIAPATAHPSYKKLDWRLVRLPGSYLPGVIQAGSYYRLGKGEWEFYAVRKPERSIVIELSGGSRYTRLIVQPDNETPEDAKRRIERAISDQR